MFKTGTIVKEKYYGFTGTIKKVFNNWEDLKMKSSFVTIDPNSESEEMNHIEKIIKGDPKDTWLKLQEIPFTNKQLNEKWFLIECFSGGAIWSCESRLELFDSTLN